MSARQVRVTINGREYTGAVEPRKLLTDFLRDDLDSDGHPRGLRARRLWGLHDLIQWRAGALVFALRRAGARRCSENRRRHRAQRNRAGPLQEKFWELHGLQCGFCTPGILLTAEALLKEIPNPSEVEIREWLSGNLCRCTGYQNIVTAIQEAAKTLTQT